MGLYSHICFLTWFITLLLILYGAFIRLWLPNLLPYSDTATYWVLMGLLLHFASPIVLELLYNIIGCLTAENSNHRHSHEKYKDKSGIIYTPDYNISFFGLEKCHPFDSQKYGRCFKCLNDFRVLTSTSRIHEPEICPRWLLFPLNKLYLFSHCYSLFVCLYLEIPLLFLPSCLLRYRVLNPMLKATMGTIEGCCIALEKGWAINLSGGYHHARRSFGGGFCIYPDIYLAIVHLRRWHTNIKKVVIIDLDAHQGNGHERDFMNDSNTYIIDAYNHSIYPGDEYAKEKIGVDVAVEPSDGTDGYLEKLDEALRRGFNEFADADFILYNAGTDILENDPLGRLKVSEDGVIKRDEMVFNAAFERNIPILMVLSGGYQKINAEIIANSIRNLMTKFPRMETGREI